MKFSVITSMIGAAAIAGTMFAGTGLAADIGPATSCADALRIQAQAGPQGEAAMKQRLVAQLQAHPPAGVDPTMIASSPALVDIAVAYGTQWCKRHPDATVADAAQAARRAQGKLLPAFLLRMQGGDKTP